MGVFATIYGTLTSSLVGQQQLIHREFWVELVSASLSIVVGILWIALLLAGKLDDVFR